MIHRLIAVLSVCLAFAVCADADLVTPLLTSVTPDGSNFAFNYSFAEAQGVLTPGSFVTFYDIAGFVSASSSNPFWAHSVQLLGITPADVTPPDSPLLTNATFVYTGPKIIVPTFSLISGDFEIVSSDGRTVLPSVFNVTSQDSQLDGDLEGHIGTVAVPGPIPEPSTLGLFSVGCFLIVGLARRFGVLPQRKV